MARNLSDLNDLDAELATALVRRWVDRNWRVKRVRRMSGGSVNQVFDLVLDSESIARSEAGEKDARIDTDDGEPPGIVAKLNDAGHVDNFDLEYASLAFYRDQTRFPVPTPLAVVRDDPRLGGSGLLMTKAPGKLLSRAQISVEGHAQINGQLARQVIDLHSHTRSTFGSALTPSGHEDWLKSFQPMIQREFSQVRDQLSSTARPIIDHVVDHLDRWLPRDPTPTLVHGDLWANNILVDDAHPDRPRITAFIDSQATYCDSVYELAYLRVFKTANERFFADYEAVYPRPGDFERRCHVYWLNTLLQHVRVFGGAYLGPCERTAAQLKRLG